MSRSRGCCPRARRAAATSFYAANAVGAGMEVRRFPVPRGDVVIGRSRGRMLPVLGGSQGRVSREPGAGSRGRTGREGREMPR